MTFEMRCKCLSVQFNFSPIKGCSTQKSVSEQKIGSSWGSRQFLSKDERHLFKTFYKSPLHPRKRGKTMRKGVLAPGSTNSAFPPIDFVGQWLVPTVFQPGGKYYHQPSECLSCNSHLRIYMRSLPVTVAGQRWFLTIFPFIWEPSELEIGLC